MEKKICKNVLEGKIFFLYINVKLFLKVVFVNEKK